jgi:hypothetical protein
MAGAAMQGAGALDQARVNVDGHQMAVDADDAGKQRPGVPRTSPDLHHPHTWLKVEHPQHSVDRGVGGDLRYQVTVLCGCPVVVVDSGGSRCDEVSHVMLRVRVGAEMVINGW